MHVYKDGQFLIFELDKTLMNIAPTAAVHKDGLCAYIDVVAGNELGEYI